MLTYLITIFGLQIETRLHKAASFFVSPCVVFLLTIHAAFCLLFKPKHFFVLFSFFCVTIDAHAALLWRQVIAAATAATVVAFFADDCIATYYDFKGIPPSDCFVFPPSLSFPPFPFPSLAWYLSEMHKATASSNVNSNAYYVHTCKFVICSCFSLLFILFVNRLIWNLKKLTKNMTPWLSWFEVLLGDLTFVKRK